MYYLDVSGDSNSAKLKLNRAKKHIEELKIVLTRFNESEPYKVRTERKPDQPHILYYCIACCSPIPSDVTLIAGDVIQNLRSALDHLARQLVIVAGNTPDTKTAFPVFNTADEFKAGAHRKICLMRQDAINAIYQVEPYQGGRGEAIWRLNRLNNIDKHNLILTTPAAITQIDVFGHLARLIPALAPIAQSGMVIRPEKFTPLKMGSILWATTDLEPDPNLKFSASITFGEPGICEGEPILVTLKSLANIVERLLSDFEALLAI